ncbi:hypothetical protein PoB_004422300 [Plakobranchus ocellatus]|uniref:Uncharacterized protein n=1 Tax=Plakobranchus ocellatus TaxID=259542 RepID=A0AAV4BEW8_9GAST|nr:hypothetical protein PoB_004422300 [Plakobranchus ocellatus]
MLSIVSHSEIGPNVKINQNCSNLQYKFSTWSVLMSTAVPSGIHLSSFNRFIQLAADRVEWRTMIVIPAAGLTSEEEAGENALLHPGCTQLHSY